MNNAENYYYLYKDSINNWSAAANPVFIAKHGYCRAVPKQEIVKVGYDLITDFTYMLNNNEEQSTEVQQLIKDWDIF